MRAMRLAVAIVGAVLAGGLAFARSPPRNDVQLYNASVALISIHPLGSRDVVTSTAPGKSARLSPGLYEIRSACGNWTYLLREWDSEREVVPLQFNGDGVVQVCFPPGMDFPISMADTRPWGYILPDSPSLDLKVVEPYREQTNQVIEAENEALRKEIAARFNAYITAVVTRDIDAASKVRTLSLGERQKLQASFEFCDVVSVEPQFVGVKGDMVWVDFLQDFSGSDPRCDSSPSSTGLAAVLGRSNTRSPWTIEAILPWGSDADMRSQRGPHKFVGTDATGGGRVTGDF
jgi:hypothetical protein